MVEVNGLKFETSIGVLFALKEVRGHKTLQETYRSVAASDIDNILEVLRVCCEKGENKRLSQDDFLCTIKEHNLGFIKLTGVFGQVIEKMLYSGMTEAEIAESKKQLMARMQAK